MTGEEELISCRQRMEDLTFPRGLVCCFKGFGKSNILFIIIPALACLVYLSSSIIKPNPKKSKCNIYHSSPVYTLSLGEISSYTFR